MSAVSKLREKRKIQSKDPRSYLSESVVSASCDFQARLSRQLSVKGSRNYTVQKRRVSRDEWMEAERRCLERMDSRGDCAICAQSFEKGPQLLLDCSHTFHRACLEALTRFSTQTIRRCPLCRREDYRTKHTDIGKLYWRKQRALEIQSWIRGIWDRRKYESKMEEIQPSTVRGWLMRVSIAARKANELASKRHSAIEDCLAEMDAAIENSRRVRGEYGYKVESKRWDHRWTGIRRLAMQRSDDHTECAICMCEMLSSLDTQPVWILSCAHLFHQQCLDSFERFNQDVSEQENQGQPVCPLCRDSYEKKLLVLE